MEKKCFYFSEMVLINLILWGSETEGGGCVGGRGAFKVATKGKSNVGGFFV